MKCLVVDDEALARRLLADYISKIPNIELVDVCMNALDAQTVLENKQVDLMFLDIQMPELTGLDFLKSLKHRPLVVFTTAYAEYALQGFELEVIDYLLKPIPFDRFFQAVNKAKAYRENQIKTSAELEGNDKDYFFVKADYKIIKINYKDVDFVEGLREYVQIHTSQGKVITLLSMTKLEEVLPSADFMRIHRSYIININKIDLVQGNMVVIGNHQLTISKSQRERFMKRINKDGLF